MFEIVDEKRFAYSVVDGGQGQNTGFNTCPDPLGVFKLGACVPGCRAVVGVEI
jgi:hypothetical protein